MATGSSAVSRNADFVANEEPANGTLNAPGTCPATNFARAPDVEDDAPSGESIVPSGG